MRETIGFTLVELITVILLLGVVSAIAIARSGKASDFEPRRFASTAAEQFRFAHGLSSSRFADPIRYSITNSINGWQFVTTSTSDGEVRRETLVADNLGLAVENGTTALKVHPADILQLEFSSAGDVSSAQLGAVVLQTSLGIELSVTGDSTHTLCIYPTGYLGTGACE